MIKNILFDMGNVLIHFDRNAFLDRLPVLTPKDRELLMREVFLSAEWSLMDWGVLTDEEAVQIINARTPEHLHEAVRKMVLEWDDPILPMEGMELLVRQLKEAGYTMYLLSNASYRQHAYWDRIPGSQYFSGSFISADAGVVKPMPEYYKRALETFRLNPQECLFIDDATLNIAGAGRVGIKGIVFHEDAEELRKKMRDMGITIP